VTVLILGLLAMTADVPAAQTPDTECQVGRERLAGHARASEAVRRLVAPKLDFARAARAQGQLETLELEK
jgi:hypothetical protein